MQIKKGQLAIIIVNILGLIFFSNLFINGDNYRLLGYVIAISIALFFVILTNKKINYHNSTLWGITILFFMHMAGVGFEVEGERLYDHVFFPIFDSWPIIRYDHVVHIYGGGLSTSIVYHFLRPILKNWQSWPHIAVILILGGLGIGSLNETVEFFFKFIDPQNGVGGYLNTSLDLIANLIGASIATVIIWVKHRNQRNF